MNKQKAKADLPKYITAKENCPILLVASDSELPKDLLAGLSTLNVAIVPLSKNMDFYEKLLWASDFMLILSDNPKKYLSAAWHNGVVPIVSAGAPGVLNYNPVKEAGNSFAFETENPWDIFAAMVRAMETFKFPHDWAHIINQAREVA